VVPTNPDGSLTYDGQPYDPSDASNPYNAAPTNPDGTATYNDLPYDPTDQDNPYTAAGGLPPVTILADAPSAFPTSAVIAVAAIAGILYMIFRKREYA
jgi:hypothetical protein